MEYQMQYTVNTYEGVDQASQAAHSGRKLTGKGSHSEATVWMNQLARTMTREQAKKMYLASAGVK